MASIQGGVARVWMLDSEGSPTGEPFELGGYILHAGPLRPDPDECVVADMKQAFVNITMEFKLAAGAFKRMLPLFYPSRRAYLRHMHYVHQVVGNSPASRKKNKPGRTGVRDRRDPRRRHVGRRGSPDSRWTLAPTRATTEAQAFLRSSSCGIIELVQ